MRLILSALVLALSIGCATRTPPGQSAEQQALTDIYRFATAANRALIGVQGALEIGITLHDAKLLSDAEHGKFLDVIERVNDEIDTALVAAHDLTTPAVTRREIMRYMLRRARDALGEKPLPITDLVVRARLTAILTTALAVLESIL